MKSYLEFREIPTKTKTKKFEVISKTDGSKLGEIKWETGYRKYAFNVMSEFELANNDEIIITVKVMDDICLDEISGFIKALMAERKKHEQVL